MNRRKRPPLLLAGLLLVGALTLIAIALAAAGLDLAVATAWVDHWARGQGALGLAIFVALSAGAMAIGMPRTVAAFAAGYGWGFGWGSCIALLATMLGSVATYAFARRVGAARVQDYLARREARLDPRLIEQPFTMAITIRLLPIGHNLLTNLLAGLAPIPALRFFMGSLIGFIPQTLIFALAGSGVQFDPQWRLPLAAVLFAASGALGWLMLRRSQRAKP